MRKNLTFTLISLLVLLDSCSQPKPSISSETESFKCAIDYIESFNKDIQQLEKFYISYYENPDIERSLEIESTHKESWGKLTPTQIAYDSDNEIILLVKAKKMPNDHLVFDFKLRENMPDKIEFFTRTGISIDGPKNQDLSSEYVMYIADRAVRINDSLIQQTVNEIAKGYDTYYLIPEIGKNISTMLIDNLKKEKYSQITKAGRLADSIQKDILEVHFDLHSWVEANRGMLSYDSIAGPSENFGFEEVKRMEGNVGYIKLNEFSQLEEAQVIASQALDSVSNCKILFFDLRDNYGGYPEMLQFLSSYFFQVPTIITTLHDRNGNIVDEIWTLDSIPGKRFNDSFPVIILTSNRTASAAEGFVNFFKKNKRALIIGETTKGAGHPAKEIVINQSFVVSIPFLRVDESDRTEGEGIIPDIQVRADKSLKKAIKHIDIILND